MTTRQGTFFRPPELIDTMADAELIRQLRADLEALRTVVAAAPTAAPSSPVSYNANPFSGNINPGSSSGLKLFQAATAERKEGDKLVAKIASNIQFIEALRDDSAAFAWSILIGGIGPSNCHILQDFKALDLKAVRLHMTPIFFDRTTTPAVLPPAGQPLPKAFAIDPANNAADKVVFYQRQRANMIGLRLHGSLNAASLASLKLKENLYMWTTQDNELIYDGVTMLQILVDTVKPSLRAGVADLKEKLRQSKLATYSYDVSEMLNKMESTFREIQKQGQTHEDYILDLFRALATGNNDIFHRYIVDKEG